MISLIIAFLMQEHQINYRAGLENPEGPDHQGNQ